MPNVAKVLTLEMKRIAAKTLRSTGLAARVKEQARLIRELEKRIKALENRPAAGPKTPAAVAAEGAAFEATPANLKKLRARLGVTQPGLAKIAGVSASAVAKWESGRIKPGPEAREALQALAWRAAAHTGAQAEPQGVPEGKGRRFRPTPASIKRLRTRLGVTQGELARLLGVSHSAVYQWEAGRLRPRDKTGAALQALTSVGKREVKRRLAAQ